MPAVSPNGSGPANLATVRAAVIAAIKDAGYLHIPEGRRDQTTGLLGSRALPFGLS